MTEIRNGWLRPARPLRLAPWCEQSFGTFLLAWGLLLQADHFAAVPGGLFYGRLQTYAPGWAWGALMILLGLGRFAAYRWCANGVRLKLSQATLVLFWIIASIAVYSRLWGATAPLSCFVAVIASWCHGRLAREITLGL